MRQRRPSTQTSEHPVAVNVQAIGKLEREMLNQQTAVDRMTAAITRVTTEQKPGGMRYYSTNLIDQIMQRRRQCQSFCGCWVCHSLWSSH